jgi:hypothetical protein
MPAFAPAQQGTGLVGGEGNAPRQEKNMIAAVEEMPADKFAFKPTQQQQTFAHLVMHMIETNYYLCAKAGDVPAPKAKA